MTKITVDFNNITGKIKPMHGVGQPPIWGLDFDMFRYLTEAGIPYSRLHDVGGMLGGGVFVDIPNLFPDFDADETNPENYTFEFTDKLITALMEAKCEPFFRLGVTIENYWDVRTYRVKPPKDFDKWARICEHVIRHYRQGWANGFNYDIKYWEIWNEPEGQSMWQGPFTEYCRLYEIASKHLKGCFGDDIKIGGYASCGFYGLDADPDLTGIGLDLTVSDQVYINNFRTFLKYITSEEHKCPIDFFSWHSYAAHHTITRHAEYCHEMLVKHGLHVEEILNEWNPCHTIAVKGEPYAASENLAIMLALQKRSLTMLNYYDARCGYSSFSGMFNAGNAKPYHTYYAFKSFNELYKLKNEVFTESEHEYIYPGAAKDGDKKVLLIANTTGDFQDIEFDIKGADFEGAEIYIINHNYMYELTDEKVIDNKYKIDARTCVEIRFK